MTFWLLEFKKKQQIIISSDYASPSPWCEFWSISRRYLDRIGFWLRTRSTMASVPARWSPSLLPPASPCLAHPTVHPLDSYYWPLWRHLSTGVIWLAMSPALGSALHASSPEKFIVNIQQEKMERALWQRDCEETTVLGNDSSYYYECYLFIFFRNSHLGHQALFRHMACLISYPHKRLPRLFSCPGCRSRLRW